MQETKSCTKCGEEYPLTAEYWHRRKKSDDGFRSHCRKCRNNEHRQYWEDNKQALSEKQREYYEINSEKRKQYQREYRRANTQQQAEYIRLWRKSNLNKVSEYERRYRQSNLDKINARKRKYRKANPGHDREYRRKYRKNNPNIMRAYEHRRRARKRNLPDTLTADDWQYALTYFNGCCAVCGRQLNDLFGEHTAAMDHWIPLSSDACLGTIPQNIIPLCHGIDGCNNKKSGKDPETWLIETYGTRKARQIMARIQAYFDSLPGSTDEDQGAA